MGKFKFVKSHTFKKEMHKKVDTVCSTLHFMADKYLNLKYLNSEKKPQKIEGRVFYLYI